MTVSSTNKQILSPIHQQALAQAEAPAYRFSGVAVSYQTLQQQVIALTQQFNQIGLKSGDRLACIAHNCPQLLQLYWACVDSGILFCPISPRFAPQQIIELMQCHNYQHYWLEASQLSDSCLVDALQKRPQLTVVPLDFNQLSKKAQQTIDPDAAVNAILTSGSSGTPKAAAHSLANHMASAAGSSELITLAAEDSWLLSLPLFHIGGLAILNRCALAGACVVFEDKNLSLAEQLIRDSVSHLSLVSAQLQQLLNPDSESDAGCNPENDCLAQVKAMLLGGGAISANLLAELSKRDIKAYTSYGMTEMGSQITTGIARTDGSSGKLLSGRELKIIDGEIWLKGECLFLGYLAEDGFNLPLDKDGWFYSKDLGHFDANGNLCIDGRADNMFISGGENIQPEEIEAALKLHPLISDAIVFPVADAKFGTLPAATLKLNESKLNNSSANQPLEAELTEFLADKIARFKRPRQYYPWPEVSSAGIKVVRKQVIAAVNIAK
ncbi:MULTISPECIES: o-succinylbenzoate--CoA ligase [unclassified Shewanella]|uniref:o-succinylbenzoate--CoA ligase n=1 Tax=unclassified Shewanella TaxID=196818 RepID=UPI001BC2E3E6|nr:MULTISPECIES: o-succinylbenzoate--CoA ligase [unclassified Shewanella]GIU20646.1 2-succinylbenzoate-CoA ligase [Shewanella sp. MBTL60-112-B1]GIU40014.1 2-succinylbenzoate-CoA ligase [Shewanella sp. MBTL60-112-B2]